MAESSSINCPVRTPDPEMSLLNTPVDVVTKQSPSLSIERLCLPTPALSEGPWRHSKEVFGDLAYPGSPEGDQDELSLYSGSVGRRWAMKARIGQSEETSIS